MEVSLRKINYPQEKVPLWAIPAVDVLECIRDGNIPQIRLPDINYSENKPRIAVILAQDKHPDRKVEDYTIFPDYVDAIVKCGAIPGFISYDYVDEQLQTFAPDAVLLIGGNFRLVKNHAYDAYERRPQTYVSMINYAMRYNLPTLAICGGMQMLSVYKGDKVKTGINEHLDAACSHKQTPYKLSHAVEIAEGSLAEKVFGARSIMVNSCHKSAIIENAAGDCIASGKATDGIVEIVEMAHPWSDFVLAVQWHPERMFKLGDKPSQRLFSSFVEAAKVYRLKKCL